MSSRPQPETSGHERALEVVAAAGQRVDQSLENFACGVISLRFDDAMAAAKKVSHAEKQAEIQELDAAARDVAKDASPNHNEVYTTDAVLPACQRPGCGKPVPEKKREAIATARDCVHLL